MRRENRSTLTDRGLNERGSASVEFIAATAVLLAPLIYLTIALTDVQNQTLGTEAMARHVSVSLARGADAAHAERVVTSIADEYGIDPDAVSLAIECTTAGECPRPGAIMRVTVTTEASLPLVPSVFGTRVAIPVGAIAVQKVSDYATGTP